MEGQKSKYITKSNLKNQIALLNLDESLEKKEKFTKIINGANDELGKLLVKEKVSSWDLLQKLIPEKSDVVDKVLKICSCPIGLKETRTDYVNRIFDDLTNLGAGETAVVRFLSDKLWPENNIRSLELSRNTTIDDLNAHINLLSILDSKKKEKKKLVCNKCNKHGHVEENCRLKN